MTTRIHYLVKMSMSPWNDLCKGRRTEKKAPGSQQNGNGQALSRILVTQGPAILVIAEV